MEPFNDTDTISRRAAIDALEEPCKVTNTWTDEFAVGERMQWEKDVKALNNLPSAQPERLTDDDFETIRIHLSAFKEGLCNQHRWEEADEYQRLINRFMSFANAQQERKRGKWINSYKRQTCSVCKERGFRSWRFCPNCGSDMRGEQDG